MGGITFMTVLKKRGAGKAGATFGNIITRKT